MNAVVFVLCTGSGGHVVFPGLSPAVYTLRVVASNRIPDKKFIKVRFEVTDDPERCTLHNGIAHCGILHTIQVDDVIPILSP